MSKLSDYNKDYIIRRYTAIEAGYVNNPNDLGKETNHGITYAVANDPAIKKVLVSQFGWNGKMADLTKAMAFWIYENEYWNKLKLTQLHTYHPLLADKLFDIGINCGVKRGGLWIQEYLNALNNQQKLYPDLLADGWIGNITFGRLEDYIKQRGRNAIVRLLNYLNSRQEVHYVEISLGREANETFTWGWLNRGFDSRVEYQKAIGLYS